MKGKLGKVNLGKRNFWKSGLWKFHRKLAVVLAVLLAFQSMPVRASQDGQFYADAGDTDGETAQGEGENGSGGNIGGSGNEGDTSGDGSEGNTGGDGSEGNTGGDGSEGNTGGDGSGGDTGGDGSEGDTSGNGSEGNTGGDGSEGDTSGNGSEGDTGGDGSEGDTTGDGSETLELEFEFPEPAAQVYTNGKFSNTVRSKDGTALNDVKIQYTIDNSEIASIDSVTGEVTFLKAGTVNITAEATKHTSTGGESGRGEATETAGGESDRGEATETAGGESGRGEATETAGGESGGGETAGGGSGGGGTSGAEPGGEEKSEGESASGEKPEGGITGGKLPEGEAAEGEPAVGESTEGTTAEETTEDTTEDTAKDTTVDEAKAIVTSISYTLVIEKAPQTIAFEETEQEFSVLYGQAFSNSASEVEDTTAYDGMGYGSGRITYRIATGEDIASVDETGNLAFQDGKTGAVTVEAVKEADDCYQQSDVIQYTIHVAYEQIPAASYTLSGNRNTGFADWYCDWVTICPPDGYLINDNNSLADTGWDSSMVLDEEGIYENKAIYFKDKTTGGITDAVPVETIRIDKLPPSGLSITYDTPLTEKVKELLSFGFYKAKLEIRLEAQDDVSGVSSFTYWLEDAASGEGHPVQAQKDEKKGLYFGTFFLEPQFDGKVTFTAADDAGNQAGNVTSGGIVIDAVAPKFSVDYKTSYARVSSVNEPGVWMEHYTEQTREDVNLYYTEALVLEFTIEEEYFYAEDVKIEVKGEKINGQKVDEKPDLTWKSEDGSLCHTASLKLEDEGVYVVALSYHDPSQNEEIAYTSEHIIIDTTRPELAVGYRNKYIKAETGNIPGDWLDSYEEHTRTDVNLYYTEGLTLAFAIKEENFYQKNAELRINGELHTLEWISKEEGGQKYAAASLNLEKDGEYEVVLSYEDPFYGEKVEYTSEHIIIDTMPPELKVDYTLPFQKASSVDKPSEWLTDYRVQESKDVNLYYNASQTLAFTIEEDNFYRENAEVKVNGTVQTLEWVTREEDGRQYHAASLQLEKDGEYVVTLRYEDPFHGKIVEYTSEHIIVDTTPPELKVDYKESFESALSLDASGEWLNDYKVQSSKDVNLYYNGSQTLEFTIKEENFYPEEAEVTVNGAVYALEWISREEGGQKYAAASLELEKDGEYVVALNYQDPSQNKKIEYTSEHIIIDTTEPKLTVTYENKYIHAAEVSAPGHWMDNYTVQERTDVTLYYGAEGLKLDFVIEEENFHEKEAEVKINGEDPASALKWEVKEEGGRKYAAASLVLKEDGEYVVTLSYDDPSHNGRVEYISEHIIIDTTSPVLAVEYGSSYVKASSVDAPGVPQPDYEEQSEVDMNLYYDGSAVFHFTIKEQNFFAEYVHAEVNGEEHTLTWTPKGDGSQEYTADLELADEGAYVVVLQYQDPSGHEMKPYTSEHIILDKKAPGIQVTYDVTEPVAGTSDIFNQARIATIIITDENIYPNDGSAVSIQITAKDALGADVGITQEYPFVRMSKETGSDADGDAVWKAVIPFEKSANYTFEMTVEDMAGHKVYYGQDRFTVDVTKPDADKFSISYSNDYQNWFEKLLGTVSFGYYRPSVTITFTAQDETTSIAEMRWFYTRQNESSAEPETKEGIISAEKLKWVDNQAIGKITLTADEAAQYRGNISLRAVDKAGNESDRRTDTGTVIVVDTITPTRTASYSPAKQVTEKKSGSTMKDYSRENVNAANPSEVGSDNGMENPNETGNCNGTENLNEAHNDNGMENPNEARNDNGMENSGKVSNDNGTEKLNGTGRSNGIDNLTEGIGAVLYYDDVMTLTLDVVEANFYAEDVKVYVYRDGRLLANGDGYHYEAGRNWVTSEKDRNAHRMTLQLGTENADSSKDGDYVVVISYSDRSDNEMPVYTSEQITIDTRKPVLGLAFPEDAVVRDGIVYLNETPSLEVVVRERNFRADDMSVTVTAKDAHGNEIPVTAGRNAGGEEVTYAQYLSDAANWISDGDEHRAVVKLWEDAAYEFAVSYSDLAMQNAEAPAGCVVKLDRKPSAWEALPYDQAYGGDYARMVDGLNQKVEHVEEADQDTRFIFQGEAAMTIGLFEDNFFPKDVELTVERDGVLLAPGTGYHYDPQDWTADSEDSTHHILHLVLGEENSNHAADGDYRVRLSYTDTAGNVSQQYVSNILTIDTTPPEVSIEYDNNEPHKEAFYGSSRTAVITVKDRNIRTDEIDFNIPGTDIWGNRLEDVTARIGNWVPGEEEGTWKNTITYDMDADYDIEILCPDMAGNQSRFTDGFTVDKGLPGLRYEYSTALMETVLNYITFGYYQPDVTVTVYVQDDIAGVDYLVWGYEKEAGREAAL